VQIAHLAYGFLANVVLNLYDYVICIYSVDFTFLSLLIGNDYVYEPIITMHCFCYTYDAKGDKFCIFDYVDL
jgi:hypothetical protein